MVRYPLCKTPSLYCNHFQIPIHQIFMNDWEIYIWSENIFQYSKPQCKQQTYKMRALKQILRTVF